MIVVRLAILRIDPTATVPYELVFLGLSTVFPVWGLWVCFVPDAQRSREGNRPEPARESQWATPSQRLVWPTALLTWLYLPVNTLYFLVPAMGSDPTGFLFPLLFAALYLLLWLAAYRLTR